MNRLHFDFSPPTRQPSDKGNSLAEYAILIAFVALITISGLIFMGGSVQGGFVKVCAALGNDGCEAAARETVVVGTTTPTLQASVTPSLIPTSTLVLADPDPTRQPVSTLIAGAPPAPPASQLITMRIKVVLSDKGGGKKSPADIRVVIYNAAGEYVGEGITDDKGNMSLSIPSGSYTIATLYNNIWQKDSPIRVTNSKENVIHR